MNPRPLLSALTLTAALTAGCATTNGELAATGEGARPDVCARAVVGSRIRNCRSPGHTMDKSIMEQQIHRCTGATCEGGG